MRTSLRDARVLVVGAGGIGAPACLTLAAAGVGTIVLADDDEIELSNLHRQILFADEDIGKSKVETLRDAIAMRAPETTIELAGGRVLPENARELVRSVDVVLDGCDNFATRFLLADACALEGRAVVHAAAVRWRGTCFVGGPRGNAPCYRCLFEDLPAEGAPDCATAGVLGPICGVVGGLAADAGCRLIEGDDDVLAKMISLEGRTGAIRRISVSRRAGCPLCGENRSIVGIERARYIAAECSA